MRQSFRFKKNSISALGSSLQNSAYDSMTEVSDVLKYGGYGEMAQKVIEGVQ